MFVTGVQTCALPNLGQTDGRMLCFELGTPAETFTPLLHTHTLTHTYTHVHTNTGKQKPHTLTKGNTHTHMHTQPHTNRQTQPHVHPVKPTQLHTQATQTHIACSWLCELTDYSVAR